MDSTMKGSNKKEIMKWMINLSHNVELLDEKVYEIYPSYWGILDEMVSGTFNEGWIDKDSSNWDTLYSIYEENPTLFQIYGLSRAEDGALLYNGKLLSSR